MVFDQRPQVHTISGVGLVLKTLGVVFSRDAGSGGISSDAMPGCVNCRHRMRGQSKWAWTRKNLDFSSVSRGFSMQTRMDVGVEKNACESDAKQLHLSAGKRIFFSAYFLEKNQLAKANCVAKSPNQSLRLGLVFALGRCAHGQRCVRWGIAARCLGRVFVSERIALLQRCRLPSPRVLCQSSRHCSCCARGNAMFRHAMRGRRS